MYQQTFCSHEGTSCETFLPNLAVYCCFHPLFQLISVVAKSNTDPVESSQPQTTPDYGEPPYWTQWNPEHYSLADGGDAIWLGGVGQAIRWEKNTEQYHRIQIPDSPITQKILAAVVDSAGNRWFGSESGLYRYDLNNQWTHFTNENSGLQSNFVNGLVAGADGIIWVIHGGPISRRNGDGSWRWYPDNTAVVTQDYMDVLHTQSYSPLWSVAGNEVWTGLFVYNGSKWQNRAPTGVEYSLSNIVADKNQAIWGLCSAVCDVAKWNGSSWSEYSNLFAYNEIYTRMTSALGSDAWADGLVLWTLRRTKFNVHQRDRGCKAITKHKQDRLRIKYRRYLRSIASPKWNLDGRHGLALLKYLRFFLLPRCTSIWLAYRYSGRQR